MPSAEINKRTLEKTVSSAKEKNLKLFSIKSVSLMNQLNDHLKKKGRSQEEEESSRLELPQLIHSSPSLATSSSGNLAPSPSKMDSSLRKSPSAIGEQVPRQLPPLSIPRNPPDKNNLMTSEDSLTNPMASPGESRNSAFPLDWFDDTEKFETRSPDLWVQSRDQSRETHHAFSKWVVRPGGIEWRPCFVLDYDVKEAKYLVQWETNSKQKWVSRLKFALC